MFVDIGYGILSMIIILGFGFIAGYLLNKIKVPGLVGMILVGLLVGPYCLNWISGGVLDISAELRQVALVIILTRSGLNLDFASLKKIGRPAILMCFIPATFEIVGTMLGSHYLLGLTWFEAILLGATLGAVSPAVVSPRMIKLIDKGYGDEHAVPKLILAGSSVDDVYTIVIFYAFLGLVKTNSFDALSVGLIPVTILGGILLGIAVGFSVALLFKHVKMHFTLNILIMISLSFLMLTFEHYFEIWTKVDISALLAIMVMGMIVLFVCPIKAKEISNGYNKLWKVFEIILFVLVGASVDISYAANNFGMSVLVLLIALSFRTVGVILCVLGTKLSWKERFFCVFAYLPKATVQASIGGIALAEGLECGAMILTVSVLSILITAPIGAFLIDMLSPKLLKVDRKEEKAIEVVQEVEEPIGELINS